MSVAVSACVQSLYVHVPFCAHKCAYCAFYSAPSQGAVVNRFVQALVRELERVAPGLEPETVFFGGGTPSLLNVAQWEILFEALHRLGLNRAREWTIECNPATVSPDKARLWRAAGVNRVSLGVQSLDEDLLDRLGRIHSRAMVYKSFEGLREAGFGNINLDLMFAIPGQTMKAWQQTLEEALALQSEHLACYELIYEEDTPFFEQLQAGMVEVDEDLAAAMYGELLERTGEAGLVQYEIANFAREQRAGSVLAGRGGRPLLPAFACRHNVTYWRGGYYQGLGPSAAGFLPRGRTKNVANTERYCELLEQGKKPWEWVESLPALRRAAEIAAFGLRMNMGWSWAEFHRATGYDLREEWKADLDNLAERGWAEWTADHFRLSGLGLRFADAAAEMILK